MTEADQLVAEAEEQAILLDKGIEFKAGKHSYIIKQPYLNTLDYVAVELLKLDYDKFELRINQDELSGEDRRAIFEEQKRMIKPNAKILARIVAIMVLNKRWKIQFLTWWYARKFEDQLTPADMLKITSIILKISNFPDFTNSIVLLSINRTTMPQTIED